VAHSARIWNYRLGGKDNFEVDQIAGDRVAEMLPIIVTQAGADRAFLGRVIRHVADREGIRQVLDIGAGLTTAEKALLTNTPEGACDYVDGDLRDPEQVLAKAARTWISANPSR